VQHKLRLLESPRRPGVTGGRYVALRFALGEVRATKPRRTKTRESPGAPPALPGAFSSFLFEVLITRLPKWPMMPTTPLKASVPAPE
jgi:hypothetical protein